MIVFKAGEGLYITKEEAQKFGEVEEVKVLGPKYDSFKSAIRTHNHLKCISVPDFDVHHSNFLDRIQDQLDIYNELQHLRNTKILDTPTAPQVQLLLTFCEFQEFPQTALIYNRTKEL